MTAAKNNPPRSPRTPPRPAAATSSEPLELVDPRWLFKALGLTALVGLFCAWLLVCVVFYKIQWQFVLHPGHGITNTPASIGLAFEEVHFGADNTGQPQIDGWWIPAEPADPTVLVLHDGKGTMSDILPQAAILHGARLNTLLIDYRGFGKSGATRPTQSNMEADAESALAYMNDHGKLHASGVLVYGTGLGASIATELAARHSEVSAVILEAPKGDVETQVAHDPRTRLIPVRMLFHENFPLAAPLATLHTPKLLIAYSAGNTPQLFAKAADPKMSVELRSADDTAGLETSLQRFLDTYMPAQVPTLSPKP